MLYTDLGVILIVIAALAALIMLLRPSQMPRPQPLSSPSMTTAPHPERRDLGRRMDEDLNLGRRRSDNAGGES